MKNAAISGAASGALIQLTQADGGVVLLQGDLTCETDDVEGTDRDGSWVEVPYGAIKTVSLAPK